MGGVVDLISGQDRPKQQKKTQAMREAENNQLKEQKRQEDEIAQQEALAKKKAKGSQSLLTGSATGVKLPSKVGAAGNPNG